jgi:nucleoside-diphosphate-sugar epimerase
MLVGRKPSPNIFVTGGSGFLGSHFLCWARRIGRAAAVVLVRAPDDAIRKRKLIRACATAAQSYEVFSFDELPQLTVVGGDVEKTLCGLAQAKVAELRAADIQEFWHFAASLRFEAGERAAIIDRNVRGAENAVKLAAALGAKRFVHVSTAYCVGAVEGLACEKPHQVARPFSNAYEAGKCYAEHAILRVAAQHGLSTTILRPSIVIGPQSTKRTGGSRIGLYGLLRELASVRDLFLEHAPIRVPVRPEIEVNLIPVDCVMRDIREIVRNEFGRSMIYHLCASHGPSVNAVFTTLCATLKVDGLKLVSLSEPASPILDMMPERIQFYAPYLRLDRRFERSLPQGSSISARDLAKFIKTAGEEIVGPHARGILRQFAARSILQSGEGHNNRDELSPGQSGNEQNLEQVEAHGEQIRAAI